MTGEEGYEDVVFKGVRVRMGIHYDVCEFTRDPVTDRVGMYLLSSSFLSSFFIYYLFIYYLLLITDLFIYCLFIVYLLFIDYLCTIYLLFIYSFKF